MSIRTVATGEQFGTKVQSMLREGLFRPNK